MAFRRPYKADRRCVPRVPGTEHRRRFGRDITSSGFIRCLCGGVLVGEGGVMFVLERESSAKARGAPIRARVLGAAVACENYHPTRPHPEGDGLGRATMAALRGA